MIVQIYPALVAGISAEIARDSINRREITIPELPRTVANRPIQRHQGKIVIRATGTRPPRIGPHIGGIGRPIGFITAAQTRNHFYSRRPTPAAAMDTVTSGKDILRRNQPARTRIDFTLGEGHIHFKERKLRTQSTPETVSPILLDRGLGGMIWDKLTKPLQRSQMPKR